MERGFTQQQISALLGVSQRTISTYLEGLEVTSKPPRPKGGRPKGSGKTPKFSQATEDYAATLVLDEGFTYAQAEAEAGVSNIVVRKAVAHERGVRAGLASVSVDALPKTSKEKMEIWQRRETRRMELEYEQRLQAKLKEHYDRLLPEYEQKLRDAEDIVRRRKGIMSAREFRLIVSCLHPDRIQDEELKRRYADAFNIMNAVRLQLVAEKEEPTATLAWPRTYQEMMAKKAKVSAARKAKRTQSNLARKGA